MVIIITVVTTIAIPANNSVGVDDLVGKISKLSRSHCLAKGVIVCDGDVIAFPKEVSATVHHFSAMVYYDFKAQRGEALLSCALHFVILWALSPVNMSAVHASDAAGEP